MKKVIVLFSIICVMFSGCQSESASDDEILLRMSTLETEVNRISGEWNKLYVDNLKLISELQLGLDTISEELENMKEANETDVAIGSHGDDIESSLKEFQAQIYNIERLLEDYIQINSSHWLFDPSIVRVGDTINGLKLIDMDYEPDGIYKNSGDYSFDGEKEITGTYEIIVDDEFLGNVVMFSLADYGRELPRVYSDGRNSWFTFTNYQEALDMLGTDTGSGIATIIISEYRISLHPSDVNNTAKLVKVINK